MNTKQMEENSNNIHFNETMFFFRALFTQTFRSRLNFVLGFSNIRISVEAE